MAEEFFVPKLGQTVEEVTLVKWLVQDGARVNFGQEVMEVETDKAVFPVEANAKGFIHLGPYEEGQVLPVLTVVAIIGKEDETFAGVMGSGVKTVGGGEEDEGGQAGNEGEPAGASPAASGTVAQETVETTVRDVFVSPRARKLAEEKKVDVSQVTPSGYGGVRVVERDVVGWLASAPKATPLAQRVAAGQGVDLHGLSGSGPHGRIVKDDVTRAAAAQAPAPVGQAPAAAPLPAAPALPTAEVVERIPLKGVRAIIADRMAASVHTSARVTLFSEVDATEFVSVRERLKQRVAEEWGFAPGYNDLLALMVARALRRFPYMNARLAPDAIELLGHVNLGMAVDTERGLLVPVVRDADQKNLRQFGSEFRTMVDRARAGRALPDDLSGGSFTITNLGMYDVEGFTPVINLPEAAILGVGRIAEKVVPFKGKIKVRKMMMLSLVFDHRLVDGAPAARFLQYIRQLVEEPLLLLGA